MYEVGKLRSFASIRAALENDDCCADYSAAACPNECDLSSLLFVSSVPALDSSTYVNGAPQWVNDEIWSIRGDIERSEFDLLDVQDILVANVSSPSIAIIASMYGQLENVGQSLPNVEVEFAMATKEKEHGKIKKLIKSRVEKIAPYASRTNKYTLLKFQEVKFDTVYRVTVKPKLKTQLRKGKKVKCASMDGLVRFIAL
jgi:hypothetical protein